MPQVTTQYDPSGSNWQFVEDRLYRYASPGERISVEADDSTGASIFGFNLWGSLTIDQVHDAMLQHGGASEVLYISLWHNPPAILGTGIDSYRAIASYK